MTLTNLTSINYRITHDVARKYSEQPTSLAAQPLINSVSIAAGANNQAMNLATMFPALTSANTIAVTILDETQSGNSSGFWLRTDGSGANLSGLFIRPNSAFSCGAGLLPNFWIDNPGANPIILTFVVSGS